MNNLKIMSNNVWWCDKNHQEWQNRGEDCSARARTPGFVRVYNEIQPDIIGLQECSPVMRDIFMDMFCQNDTPYAMLYGRDTPILYRKDKFELVDSDFLIYPEYIDGLDGSFNNAKTKSCSIAVFRVIQTGSLLIFASTHLWWKSETVQPGSDLARKHQLSTLIDRVAAFRKKYNCPAIIVGDLNATYSSPAVSTALDCGFAHAYDLCNGERDESCGMHFCCASGYETNPDPKTFFESIDHILLTPDVKVDCFKRYAPDYYMPLSDHAPVYIEVNYEI